MAVVRRVVFLGGEGGALVSGWGGGYLNDNLSVSLLMKLFML